MDHCIFKREKQTKPEFSLCVALRCGRYESRHSDCLHLLCAFSCYLYQLPIIVISSTRQSLQTLALTKNSEPRWKSNFNFCKFMFAQEFHPGLGWVLLTSKTYPMNHSVMPHHITYYSTSPHVEMFMSSLLCLVSYLSQQCGFTFRTFHESHSTLSGSLLIG